MIDIDLDSSVSKTSSHQPQFGGGPGGSAANPALQRVLDKQYADKIKLTVKKLLKKIDSEKTSQVKFDVL